MPAAFTMDDWNSAVRALRNGSVAGLLAMHESGAVSESEAVGAIAGLWHENPWQGVAVLCQLREQPSEAARRIAALVENLSLPAPGRRWSDSTSLWLFSPRFRLIWSLASLAVLHVLVAMDWLARLEQRHSFLAPTAVDLWLGIGLGALVGAIGAAWERFLLIRRSADQIAFLRTSLKERLRSPYLWKSLLESGWFLLLMLGLIGWCAYFGVFILPVILAENAVQFLPNLRLVARFRAELESAMQIQSEPC